MNDDLATIERKLLDALATAKANGWREADLTQAMRQLRNKPAADLFVHLHLGVEGWRQRRAIAPDVARRAAQYLLVTAKSLRPLPQVDGAPSEAGDASVLAKVRALLAKAESTTYEAEADALNAKACELMARHAIDAAMVQRTSGSAADGATAVRRIFTDNPYAKARFHLLSTVARTCRCRAIWSQGFGFAHVFGAPADLEATELLFTSLLVQATTAMVATSPSSAAASSTAAYRRAFLVAFAGRIGERLRDGNDQAVADARREHGDAILPVLASKEQAAEDALREFAPDTRTISLSVSNHRGWSAGKAAADRAALSHQAPLPARRAAIGGG